MKKVFKANFEKQKEQSAGESVFMSFGRIAFYMEKHPNRETGFEFIPLYPVINQTFMYAM